MTIEPGTHMINLPNGQSALERLRRARDDRLKTLVRDCNDQDAARLRHDEGLREAA